MDDQDRGLRAGSEPSGGALGSLLRNLVILVVVVGMAAWALSYRDEVSQALRKALPEMQPPAAPAEGRAGPGDEPGDGPAVAEAGDSADEAFHREIVIHRAAGRHFLLDATVQGTTVRFLVDTGASDIVLSPEDARRLHLNPGSLDYSLVYQTANGPVRAAPVTLRNFRIGQLELYELDASVNEAPMAVSLLGMTFLQRLAGYEVEGDRLTLRW